MTKRIVLQGLELWGDVHYTVHRSLAQSHPQQLWSRSPVQPLMLWTDGAYGEEWEDKHSCPSHLSVQSSAYHLQLHRDLDSKGLKNSNPGAARLHQAATLAEVWKPTWAVLTSGAGSSSKKQAVIACVIPAIIPSHRVKTHILPCT